MAELYYLQVARVCNQQCLFCSNPENGRVITWADAAAQIDSFAEKKAAGVIMTGGEPTLFPRLPKLIAYALAKKMPVRLITNGQKTAKIEFFRSLAKAGLDHMHVSVHSCRAKTQGELSRNPDSLANIIKTLDNAVKLGVRVDINTTINRRNASELSEIVRWVVGRWPSVRHFVWNNLDPLMNKASLNPELIPRLRDFEVELNRAMTFLESTGRTFRVERVPLCYMGDFPHRSTETRKLVKREVRSIYFLDEKGLRDQNETAWTYGKTERCHSCTLESICAGLYQMDVYYASSELCPVLTPLKEVERLVREDRND